MPIIQIVADRLVDVERLQGRVTELVFAAEMAHPGYSPSLIQVAFLFLPK